MEIKKREKLQFRIDLALTVLFIAAIFFFLFGTIKYEHGLWGHTFYMRYVSQYLEDSDDYTTWDLVEASIASLDNFISQSTYGTSTLGKINSAFQYGLGKRLVSTGNSQMIRLNTGHLYDIQLDTPMEPGRDDVLAMRDIVPEGTPFLFAYEHPTLYDVDAQMPEGYGFLDHGIEDADEIVGMLRAEGVDVLDSREVLRATGLPLEDYLMYTDQHWATRAAIIMAQAIAERVEQVTGVDLPTERLDIDQFETTVYPKLFMGKYGQRVGTRIIDPDDIITYAPKYETNIHHVCSKDGVIYENDGSFDEVMLNRSALRLKEGKSWNITGYTDYGLVEDYDIMTNEDGGDCTILLLKDSYSAAVGRFLSLVADEVYSMDLRSYYTGSLAEMIEEYHPDAVVVAYSLQMLRNEKYEFE